MKVGRLHHAAYIAHDLAMSALTAYAESIKPNGSGHKPSAQEITALAELSRVVEQWQERIRIHRRQPLPGTLRPVQRLRKAANRGGRRPDVLQAPVPAEHPGASESEPLPSGSEGDGGADPMASEPFER